MMVRQMDILVVRRGGGEATGPVGPDGVSSCVQSEANLALRGRTKRRGVRSSGKQSQFSAFLGQECGWGRKAKPIA